jgi:LysR family transcriptional activator of nhaA
MSMDWLNYHHLLYFWAVAKHGSVTRASRELHLAQPTVSAQLKALEQRLGQPLFDRAGRRLVLTELGHTVFAYAEEIFALGRELLDTVRQQRPDRGTRLRVGIADVVPKLVAETFLRPALSMEGRVQLVCREGKAEALESELGRFGLDLVVTDTPLSPGIRVKAFAHPLGSCPVCLFASGKLARRYRPGFPESLDGAPALLPAGGTVVRSQVDAGFDRLGIRPIVMAEFDDSALMKVFGMKGLGVFPAPDLIADEVCRQYGVKRLGALPGAEERFYAITVDRRILNPAVVAICDAARDRLDGP